MIMGLLPQRIIQFKYTPSQGKATHLPKRAPLTQLLSNITLVVRAIVERYSSHRSTPLHTRAFRDALHSYMAPQSVRQWIPKLSARNAAGAHSRRMEKSTTTSHLQNPASHSKSTQLTSPSFTSAPSIVERFSRGQSMFAFILASLSAAHSHPEHLSMLLWILDLSVACNAVNHLHWPKMRDYMKRIASYKQGTSNPKRKYHARTFVAGCLGPREMPKIMLNVARVLWGR